MSFTSGGFLLFLCALFAVYYLPPRRFRWWLLLLGSLVFYAFSGFLLCLLLTALSAYVFGLILERKRSRLLTTLWFMLHMGFLLAVKLPMTGLIMPLGVSFYTFQCAGYVLDVYRNKAKAERNPARFLLFAGFFPQLIQGPIGRRSELAKSLYTPSDFSWEQAGAGFRRILLGYFKKLVIADRLMAAVTLMTAEAEQYRGVYALLNILLYAVTLYADFTGGIDISIGTARFLGVTLTENFQKPFYARSTAEYWRRWHITMGTWFRDYLFYPLSVSKAMRRFSKKSRKLFGNGLGKRLPVHIATMLTWFATGLWHGTQANFLCWGIANGAVIVLSQECEPLYKRFHARFGFTRGKLYEAFAIARTFCLMSLIRSFDIYRDVGLTLRTVLGGLRVWDFPGLLPVGPDLADALTAAFGVLLLIVIGREKPRAFYERRHTSVRLSLCILLLLITLVFGVYGYGYDATEFIYNQF